jgi:hypothetical protein
MRENREIPCLPSHPQGCGPLGEGVSRTPGMHGHGKSDCLVVPAKLPNNAARAATEVVEERRQREGSAASNTCPGLRAGSGTSRALDRVRRLGI